MLNFLLLTAEGGAEGAQNGVPIPFGMIFSIVIIFVLFYFLLIRPEKKQAKQINEMRNSLKVGDEVTTIGGIIGVITYINDDDNVIAIKSGVDGAELRFARWAIGTKTTAETSEESANNKKK